MVRSFPQRIHILNRRTAVVIVFLFGCFATFFVGYNLGNRKPQQQLCEFDQNRVYKSPNYKNLDKSTHFGKLESKFRCHAGKLKLLIVSTSNVSSFDRRRAIRETWGRGHYKRGDTRTFFAVGKSYDRNTMKRLAVESHQHRDIIKGDFYEKFYNLPYKFEMILEWAYKYCDFEYLLKTDDDVFVNLHNIYELLDSQDIQHTRLYLGRAKYTSGAVREGKYAVTYEEYAKDRYPPFVGGGAVVFSRDVVESMVPFFHRPVYKLDDIYIAILIANTGVPTTHNERFKFVSEKKRLCHWDGDAITLHFQYRKNVSSCMKKLYYNMLKEKSITLS